MSEPDTPLGLIWLLYIIITCICTFLLLGLFVAVVTGTFAQVMATSKSSTPDEWSRICVRPCCRLCHSTGRPSPTTKSISGRTPRNESSQTPDPEAPTRWPAKVREAEGSSGFVRAPSADGDDDEDGIDWINNGPYSRDDPNQMPVGDKAPSIGMLMQQASQKRQAEQVMGVVSCCWGSGF
jgi:hypothetical protein